MVVGRDQQIEHLPRRRRDDVPLIAGIDGHARLFRAARASPQRPAHQHLLDPPEKILIRIGLAHEAVGPVGQAAQDVRRIDQGGEQDHRRVAPALVGFDGVAQRIAVHLGHLDVGQHQVRCALAHGLDRRLAVACHSRAVAMRLNEAAQLLRLRWAVLDDQDLDVLGFRAVLG